MDRYGPRLVMPLGAIIVALGFVGSTWADDITGMYISLGIGVVGGSIFISYIGHSLFLPRWFERRRGLAVGIAFSGVGVGAIIMLPAIQGIISNDGWRSACLTLSVLLLVLVPLNALLQRKQPADIGLQADGIEEKEKPTERADKHGLKVINQEWVRREWTVRQALATSQFWWLAIGYLTFLYSWYAILVHQTKYLIELDFAATDAAFALGLVGLASIGGQIILGHLSDRIGRELAWSVGSVGFVLCYLILLLLPLYPWLSLVYLMAVLQGFLGNGLASVYASIAADIFQGKHYGKIFGLFGLASGLGAGIGPWVTGLLYDLKGDYRLAFILAILFCLFSVFAVWIAAPRKIRQVF